MYIPLNNKSNYTLLSSMLKIDDLINYAKNNNISSIALADTNMFGTMEFYKKCQKENIKPVIGLNILGTDYEINLYAEDYTGYKNLIKLATIQSERVITIKDLEKYNKNIIGILPFTHKNKYDELNTIYINLYLGYKNKEEEKEARIITKNLLLYFLYINFLEKRQYF